jgi:hypothetical protein
MMTKAMHQIMIDHSKVFTNTIQNCLTEALKKGAAGGYLVHAYFQPNRTPPMFQHNQSDSPQIDDPKIGISPYPHINATAPGSSSDSQPIQNQCVGDKAKNPAITMSVVETHPTQSDVQDQTFLVQNLLTPKLGTGKRLTCGPSLVEEHHSAKGFPQSIR